ncbi:MAG TPA: vanadium-dependent haloperoxidase [Micromonosporaceae bacterium]|nr:vanadium-dependent haloperoxidase [Micromonosporaceae bacterium]
MGRGIRRGVGLVLAAVLVSVASVFAVPQTAHAATTATLGTVYYWNDSLLEAFRRQGGGPGPLSRAAAMMHGAVFDVLNSAQWARQANLGNGYAAAFTTAETSADVDDDLAAGIAARDVLIDALPQQSAYVQQRYSQRHGGAGQAAASALADQVVQAVRANRANDGANTPAGYTPDNVPGAWRPTGGCTPVHPHWGAVRPFVMTSSAQVRRPAPGFFATYPSLLASTLYTTQLNEVRELGRADSTSRTPEQTQIAFYWANDANGTYKPPGHLLDHTAVVALPRFANPIPLARLFARVSFVLADAAIAAWDQKFRTPIDLWRPIDAIRLAGTDDNPATVPDSTWQPLGATPCFPAWSAGHAAFAGAWAGVMRQDLGDNVTYTAGTEDPNARGVTRTFTSFTQAAAENARSRVYLGVHFQFDNDDGLASGGQIADLAVTTMSAIRCAKPCA